MIIYDYVLNKLFVSNCDKEVDKETAIKNELYYLTFGRLIKIPHKSREAIIRSVYGQN